MTQLFAYGTLRDEEYQQALFDHTLPARPATLPGWRAVVSEGGYLTVVRAAGDEVTGDLLALDDAALATADAWEEVPLYERVAVEVRTADGSAVEAQVYVRPSASRERAPDGILAQHGRHDVLAQIRQFRLRNAFRNE
jgi:gamma-glutamylcyclotransferase (GGCT)/AIG2-like uncharacterized protein YtfP